MWDAFVSITVEHNTHSL